MNCSKNRLDYSFIHSFIHLLHFFQEQKWNFVFTKMGVGGCGWW